MINRIKVCLLGMIMALGLVSCTPADINEPFQEGVHYDVLDAFPESEKPQVILFFSPACPHCNVFSQTMKDWESKRSQDVNYIRVPVTFAKSEWATLTKMYATAMTLKVNDHILTEMFKAIHDQRIMWFDLNSILMWFELKGVDAAEAHKAWSSEAVNKIMLGFVNAESSYAVRSIPRLIVNGRYEVRVKEFEDDPKNNKSVKTDENGVIVPATSKREQLDDVIEYLLRKV